MKTNEEIAEEMACHITNIGPHSNFTNNKKVFLSMLDEKDNQWETVIEIVNEQAEDGGLWFDALTAPETYLQHELRRLHRVIESMQV